MAKVFYLWVWPCSFFGQFVTKCRMSHRIVAKLLKSAVSCAPSSCVGLMSRTILKKNFVSQKSTKILMLDTNNKTPQWFRMTSKNFVLFYLNACWICRLISLLLKTCLYWNPLYFFGGSGLHIPTSISATAIAAGSWFDSVSIMESRMFPAMPPSAGREFAGSEKEQGLEVRTVNRQSPSNRVREVQVTGTAEVCCLADRVSVRVSVANSKESVNEVTNRVSRRLEYILQTLRWKRTQWFQQ